MSNIKVGPKPSKLIKTSTWQGVKRNVVMNTDLRCKNPMFRNSCQHAGKVGTCALVRQNPNGTITAVPPDQIDKRRDICFVSPPYVPLEAEVMTDNSGAFMNRMMKPPINKK